MSKKLVALAVLAVLVAGGVVTWIVLRDGDGRPNARENVGARDRRREEQPRKTNDPRVINRQIVVGYKPKVGASERVAVRKEADARLLERLPIAAHEVVKVKSGQSVQGAIDELEAQPEVAYAVPNYVVTAYTVPNDPRFSELWGLTNVSAPEAWDVTQGSREVVVAVVDSGVAYDHPDLAPNIWRNPGESGGGRESNGIDDDDNGFVDDFRGWDFVGDDNDPQDTGGHGTHVAGTIGARGNDGHGVVGVNWAVSILPIRVLDTTGNGATDDVLAAVDYAGKMGAAVTNLSLGTSASDAVTAYQRIMSSHPNTLFVSAAGNDENDVEVNPAYPCATPVPNNVCVAAIDQSGALADYSNFGASSVHLAAPGSGILSTQPHFDSVLVDGFEADLSRWASEGLPWGRGVDEVGAFATDSPQGSYADTTVTSLRNAEPLNLSGKGDCHVNYWGKWGLGLGDSVFFEASADGATWSRMIQMRGSSEGWRKEGAELSFLDGRAQVYVRFLLQADQSLAGDGIQIDNVNVRCVAAGYVGQEFVINDGTSMATPHVAGSVALLYALAPDATVDQVRTALLASVDAVPSLAGKSVTGGKLNVARAMTALTGG